jgi:hypothetical protein
VVGEAVAIDSDLQCPIPIWCRTGSSHSFPTSHLLWGGARLLTASRFWSWWPDWSQWSGAETQVSGICDGSVVSPATGDSPVEYVCCLSWGTEGTRLSGTVPPWWGMHRGSVIDILFICVVRREDFLNFSSVRKGNGSKRNSCAWLHLYGPFTRWLIWCGAILTIAWTLRSAFSTHKNKQKILY